METAFLVVAIVGLLVTLNAWRPLSWTHSALPVFFGGWLTSELALHHLVAHVAVVAAFVASGAAQGWQGWVAVGISVASAAGLVGLIVQSHAAKRVTEAALCSGLGDGYLERIRATREPSYDLRVPYRRLVLPFWMRHRDVERLRNVSYGDHGRRNRLDVYRPRDARDGCPVLVQIHGGGWTIGSKDQQGRPLMLHMASKGWVCVAVNYRLSPRSRWPAHIVDVKQAIAWVRQNIARYGGDARFVAVTGGSAGGHLAALAALTPDDPRYQPGFEDADTGVQACVPYYGVYDLTDGSGTRMGAERLRFLERVVFRRRFSDAADEFAAASPVHRVRPDAPPFFVIHGTHDSLVPVAEARTFVSRLREVSRSPVCYAELPGAQHAFDVFTSIRSAHVAKAVERFLDHAYCTHGSESGDARRRREEQVG